jgi:hypothetical protein
MSGINIAVLAAAPVTFVRQRHIRRHNHSRRSTDLRLLIE